MMLAQLSEYMSSDIRPLPRKTTSHRYTDTVRAVK